MKFKSNMHSFGQKVNFFAKLANACILDFFHAQCRTKVRSKCPSTSTIHSSNYMNNSPMHFNYELNAQNQDFCRVTKCMYSKQLPCTIQDIISKYQKRVSICVHNSQFKFNA